MAELLTAARILFGERGFDSVSVRDISKHANVNHALLHRHFGTKENLLHDLMQGDASRFAQAIRDVEDPADAMRRLFAMNAEDPSYVRILAYALLGSVNTDVLVVADGTLRHIAGVLAAEATSADGTRAAKEKQRASAAETTAIVTALALGWLIFEPFLAAATGIEESRLSEVRGHVEALVGDLVDQSVHRS